MNPQFPLYIPSKGRADSRLTNRALTAMGIPHTIVVEPQEADEYVRATRGTLATILAMDMSYKEKYEVCDKLGMTKPTGAGAARNFLWDHSISEGHSWHWTMDDNLRDFRRLNGGAKIIATSGAIFRAMEDFVLRYRNVAMAGPNYSMFAYSADPAQVPPFYLNTRIYSCNLIRNDLPFRWRGRYNEDTILSLDMLKAGWCTVQFNAFLQGKVRTQTLRGGNTDELYQDGTFLKSRMQVEVHPDVSSLVWKYGRWHHHVNYRPFQRNRLVLRDPGAEREAVDEYGMKLVDVRVSTRGVK